MYARKQIGFFAFLLTLGAIAVEPAYANCPGSGIWKSLVNGVCWNAEGAGGNQVYVSLHGGDRIGNYVPKHYNIRIEGGKQFEKSVNHGFRAFTTRRGNVVAVQACRKRPTRSICTSWSQFSAW